MKIGMIVAVVREIEAFFNEYGESLSCEKVNGFQVYSTQLKGNDLYIVQSGAGEIGGAAATQFLISKYDVELIVNYGVVGSLDPKFDVKQTVIVKDVVHSDFDTSDYDKCEPGRYMEFESTHIPTSEKYLAIAAEAYPDLPLVSCCSADKFIEGGEKKSALNRTWDCQICDMESAGIVITCKRNGVDMLLIKAVSDSASGGAVEFESLVRVSSQICMSVLMKILERI